MGVNMNYKVLRNIEDHIELQNSVALDMWPQFMLEDPIADEHWWELFEYFPECQFSLSFNDEIIGIGNSIPFHWDRPFEELPEKGWDWVFEKGLSDYKEGKKLNVLNGLQIVVSRNWLRKGVSTMILQEMANIAVEKKLPFVTIPVRPSSKSNYPLISIDNYITWKRGDGLLFDPWLRVHERFGGKIIKPCHEAMYIPGTVSEWESWTGMKFPESGKYIIPEALNPVEFDVEKDIGIYIEPNVWILHEMKKFV